jgi:hypothetical protein
MLSAQLDSPVALVGNSGVEMVVTISCRRGEFLQVSPTIQQASPSHTLAAAESTTYLYCKAGSQKLRVDALAGGPPFLKPGTAVATLAVQCLVPRV